MTIASIPLYAGQRESALLRYVKTLAASFRWAMEVQHRCERVAANGRQLDGVAVREIVDAVNEGR